MMNFRQKIRDFFIPSLQNELRPYSLRYGTLIFVVALSVSIELVFYAYVNVAFRRNDLLGNIISSIQTTVADVLPEVIVQNTNSIRIKNGEKPLMIDPNLERAARLKAEDMVSKSYFSHEGPDGSVTKDWIEKANYQYSYAGENLAVNFFDASDVVNAWMKSPSHRENILNPNFTEIGIAAIRGFYNGQETVFVVQMFGSKAVEANLAIAMPEATLPPPPPALSRPVEVIPEPMTATTVSSSSVLAATSSPLVLGQSASATVVAKASAEIPLSKRMLVSPRHVARDAYIVLLVYMFLSLVIPMYMIYHKHASADRWLRFREIFILFKKPIYSALVTLVCISAVMVLNYTWSWRGTNVFPSMSIGEAVDIDLINK